MASTAPAGSVVHILDATNSFNESEWIGVGKKYQDVPPEVSDERNKVLWIPELHFEQQFPVFNTKVTQLVALKLPKVSNSIPSFHYISKNIGEKRET